MHHVTALPPLLRILQPAPPCLGSSPQPPELRRSRCSQQLARLVLREGRPPSEGGRQGDLAPPQRGRPCKLQLSGPLLRIHLPCGEGP